MRAIVGIAIILGTIVVCPASSHALAIVADKYCSAGTNTAIVGDTISGSLLSLSDVDLTVASTTYTPSDCYGDFDPGPSNAAIETSAVNDIFGGIADPQKLYHLDGTGQDPSATGIGGITFVVGSSTGDDDGTWTVTWTDSNSSAPQNLPIYVDLVLLLNGGNNNAAYLLSNVLFPAGPTSGGGTFDIQFLNSSLRNQPNISHLTLVGRIAAGPEINQVSEPASMMLFGVGLLSLSLMSRRRKCKR
jgi:hypothetical protein